MATPGLTESRMGRSAACGAGGASAKCTDPAGVTAGLAG